MSDLRVKLDEFLAASGQNDNVEQLTPDASTREYFRIDWNGRSAIACVYPEPFVASEQSYIDVTELFASNDLPVAEIYSYDEAGGVIIQEDLGDTILRDVLLASETDKREKLIDQCITLIARIQAATASAYATDSIASRLKFDVDKLVWELNFFREHYFTTLRKTTLNAAEDHALDLEFNELCSELEDHATVLCHRDFHSANLMIDRNGNLRIIDHQDARIGSPAYDLVSLLLDRVTALPTTKWLASKRQLLLAERTKLGLEVIDDDEFTHQFRLQTVQRCLKAVGTFSYQSVNRGKTHFLPFINPMFETVLRALERLHKFPMLTAIVEEQINGGSD
jgi:aminoglycoside/choline kinase family phosphotransferase